MVSLAVLPNVTGGEIKEQLAEVRRLQGRCEQEQGACRRAENEGQRCQVKISWMHWKDNCFQQKRS